MITSISLDAILSMLQPLSIENKRWLAGKLFEQVGDDEMILGSEAFKEAVDDVHNGNVTKYGCAEDMFKAFGI